MPGSIARAALRARLSDGRLIVAPGVFDGISAHLVARLGFPAGYLTGAGVAASGFGLPDIGLVTQTEMAERARMLTRVLGDVPLIADADTGYGAPLNVVRTVQEYEAAGVAAIQLEDQAFPKKCGHLPDKELIEPDEFVAKLDAALDARRDPDLVVIARTDARGPLGIHAAIARANAYARAGADVIFVEAPQGADEVERIAKEVTAPLLINMVIGGLTPIQPAERLAELGYAIAIYPTLPLMGGAAAMVTALAGLAGRDAQELIPSTPAELFGLVGLGEWTQLRGQPSRPGGGRADPARGRLRLRVRRRSGVAAADADQSPEFPRVLGYVVGGVGAPLRQVDEARIDEAESVEETKDVGAPPQEQAGRHAVGVGGLERVVDVGPGFAGAVNDHQVAPGGQGVPESGDDLPGVRVVRDEVQDRDQQHRHRLAEVDQQLRFRGGQDGFRLTQVGLDDGGPAVVLQQEPAVGHGDGVDVGVDHPGPGRGPLFTDGLVETRTQTADEGLRALRRALAGQQGPLPAVCDRVLASLGHHGEDDTTLVLARMPPGQTARTPPSVQL